MINIIYYCILLYTAISDISQRQVTLHVARLLIYRVGGYMLKQMMLHLNILKRVRLCWKLYKSCNYGVLRNFVIAYRMIVGQVKVVNRFPSASGAIIHTFVLQGDNSPPGRHNKSFAYNENGHLSFAIS